MAWDFETEPEYQEKLDWADTFVREEVEPLDLLCGRAAVHAARRQPTAGHRPAEGAGPRAGAVGHPPRPRARRQGLRPAQARRCSTRSSAGRAGRRSCSAARRPTPATPRSSPTTARPSRRSSYLRPLLDGEIFSCYSMTEPHAGADPTHVHDPRRQGRRRVGHQRLEVLLVERQDRRRSSSSWRSPTPTSAPTRACRCSWCRPTRRASTSCATSGSPASRADEGSHALIHYEDVRVPAEPARRRGPGVRHRADPARRRPHPPRHADDRPGQQGARHDVRAGAEPRDAGQPASPTSSSCRATSPTRTPS